MKLVYWIIFLALLGAGVYYYNVFDVKDLSGPSKESLAVAAFSADNRQNFLNYNDVEYGFSVQYPIGFYAEKDSESGAKVSFKAVLNEDLFELLRVDVFNQSISPDELVKEESEMKLLTRKSVAEKGKSFELLELETPNPSGTGRLLVYQGVFNGCKNNANNQTYSAIVSAVIPKTLKEDENMALYYVYNFKC